MLIRFLQTLFLLIYSILLQCSSQNVGSVFFRHRLPRTWGDTDLARLQARRTFDRILPKEISPNDVNRKYVYDILRYFKSALKRVKNTDEDTRLVLKESLADTIGGYLRAEMLPNARYAFYAGNLLYDDLAELNVLYDEIKEFLDTQGQGWTKPRKLKRSFSFNVESIDIIPRERDPCSKLIALRDSNDCIKIPMPMLDEKDDPSSIALPWKKRTLMGLTSRRSSQILIRFYRTATECILKESPLICRNSAFSRFNRDICHWMKRDVLPHLEDEKWYAGFGGVLRVGATVQNFCNSNGELEPPVIPKGQSFKEFGAGDRHKDELFQNPNTILLVQSIVALAVSIWLFLSMLTCFYRNRWRSKDPEKKPPKTTYIAAAATTNSYGTETERASFLTRRSKSALMSPSLESTIMEKPTSMNTTLVNAALVSTERNPGPVNTPPRQISSVKTESVFDMNEQRMKEMLVPECPQIALTEQMKEHHGSSDESRSTSAYSTELTSACRSTSPPRLETTISQFRVKRAARSGDEEHLPVYSTSECTSASRSENQSTQTFVKASESLSSSAWTSSSCTGGAGGGSSVDSQEPRGARRAVARIAKDLAWAKRIASRHRRKRGSDEPSAAALETTSPSRSSYKTTA